MHSDYTSPTDNDDRDTAPSFAIDRDPTKKLTCVVVVYEGMIHFHRFIFDNHKLEPRRVSLEMKAPKEDPTNFDMEIRDPFILIKMGTFVQVVNADLATIVHTMTLTPNVQGVTLTTHLSRPQLDHFLSNNC